jgi:hypothetical protein
MFAGLWYVLPLRRRVSLELRDSPPDPLSGP